MCSRLVTKTKGLCFTGCCPWKSTAYNHPLSMHVDCKENGHLEEADRGEVPRTILEEFVDL